MERLTFNLASRRVQAPQLVFGRRPPGTPPPSAAPSRAGRLKARVHAITRERYDWDYVWMLAFTALLFVRPQDHFPQLAALHLAELTAIAGLAAMAVRRLGVGQTITKVNSEVVAVLGLGAVIVLTIPSSFWPGGSLTLFSDIYVKIILIFALMMSTLTTPKRLRQMTWLMVMASGYIAARGVFDYARGVNVVEGNRLSGAVGGVFENPNDLALNLVTFMAPTLLFALYETRLTRRVLALGIAAVMMAAIVFTKSRSGFLGLAAMLLVAAYYVLKDRPATIVAIVFAGLVALPVMPQSFWDRMATIGSSDIEQTGSRDQRIQLMRQGLQVFANYPLTGIGAGQFPNYDGPEMIERWRVTHNVWLQVAAELGIFGLLTFAFLVWRALTSSLLALWAIRPPRRARPPTRPRRQSASGQPGGDEWTTLTPVDRRLIEINSKGMIAALAGWFVCAFFASVAFNWTFYYVLALAVAGRDIALARRISPSRAAPQERASVQLRPLEVGA